MQQDARGLEISTESSAAASLADEALVHFLEYRADTADLIARALEADQDFVMPRILRTGALLLMGTTTVSAAISAELAALRSAPRPETLRERLHVQALESWAAGDVKTASAIWERIVIAWPHDLLALRSLHFQNFWMGEARYMRQVVGGVSCRWSESDPGYGFVLGMLAFGHEECSDYALAERYGRQAVELNPDDMWSIHAVAHVMEMQGRVAEGRSWLDHPVDQWTDRGPFKGHLWWHAALFALEDGAFDAALDLYDAHVRPGERFVSTDMMNAPSLLARLEFQGVDTGDRWERLAERSTSWIEDHVIAFTDAHTMFPLARTGRQEEAQAFLASLERFSARQNNYAASTVRPYLLPLAEAIKAFYEGQHDRVIELLLPLRASLQPVGGSFAQRDIFEQLLLEASIKAGNWPLARQLGMERTTLRPGNGLGWRKLATILDAIGERQSADEARERAAQSLTVPSSPSSLPV